MHGLEFRRRDDRRHCHLNHVGFGFALASFPILGVEAVTADKRCSCEYLVYGVDTPACAVAGSDARFIQMLGDGLDAHRSGGAVAFPRQTISVAGYDGMHLIYEALKKTNGSTNGSKLVEAM